MRLIDADELLMNDTWLWYDENGNYTIAGEAIENAPTVDAVEVMLCKDCRFYASGWCKKWLEWSNDNNGFCSWSEGRKRWQD